MSDLPARSSTVPRAALERVLARAAELQASGSDDGGELTEAQLVELAAEVGLAREHVRQALAEERVRVNVTPDRGIAASVLGTATVRATRVVPGEPADVLAAIDRWMQKTESLQVKRRFTDQLAWEPRVDFISAVRRTLRVGGRGFHLAAANEVRCGVAPLGDGRTQVHASASYDTVRDQRLALALGVSAAGVLIGLPAFYFALDAGLTAAAVLALLPGLGIPALATTLVRRKYQSLVTRGQVALEQALDLVEHDAGAQRGR